MYPERPPWLSAEEVARARRQANVEPTREQTAEIQRGIFARTIGMTTDYPLPWTSHLGISYPAPTGEGDYVTMLTFLPRTPEAINAELRRFIPQDGIVVAHFARMRNRLNLLDLSIVTGDEEAPPANQRIRPPDTPLLNAVRKAASDKNATFCATAAKGGTETWKNMAAETKEFDERHGVDRQSRQAGHAADGAPGSSTTSQKSQT